MVPKKVLELMSVYGFVLSVFSQTRLYSFFGMVFLVTFQWFTVSSSPNLHVYIIELNAIFLQKVECFVCFLAQQFFQQCSGLLSFYDLNFYHLIFCGVSFFSVFPKLI